jgi:hypothetical protein
VSGSRFGFHKCQRTTVVLYTDQANAQGLYDRDDVVEALDLDNFVSVDKIVELSVVAAEYPWYPRRQPIDETKKLLVHWKRGSGVPLQLMEPPVEYKEECCDGSFVHDTNRPRIPTMMDLDEYESSE